MDVKSAVSIAKEYVVDLFGEDSIEHLALEEVEHDTQNKEWSITIGFDRPWQSPAHGLAALAQSLGKINRAYKVVKVDEVSAAVKSVKNREFAS